MRGPTYAILGGAWLLIVGPLSILAPGTRACCQSGYNQRSGQIRKVKAAFR